MKWLKSSIFIYFIVFFYRAKRLVVVKNTYFYDIYDKNNNPYAVSWLPKGRTMLAAHRLPMRQQRVKQQDFSVTMRDFCALRTA